MKSLTLMIGACVVILLLGAVLAGIEAFLMTDQVEPYNVTTGAATTTTIPLTHDVFGDETLNISISSNVTEDAPVPQTYTAASNEVLISGLSENTTRRLTITYKVDALWYFPGVNLAARFWPVFIVLGVLGLVVAAVISAQRRGDE